MTPEQAIAFAAPCTDPADFSDRRFHHLRGAWRVVVIVDGTAAVPERWPCWHVTVLHGEMIGMVARPATPLVMWSRKLRREAVMLIRKQLARVGIPESQEIVSVERIIEVARQANQQQPPAGISGRRRMTVAEARECFASNPAALNRINPTFRMLDG